MDTQQIYSQYEPHPPVYHKSGGLLIGRNVSLHAGRAWMYAGRVSLYCQFLPIFRTFRDMEALNPKGKTFTSDTELNDFMKAYGREQNKAFRRSNTRKLKNADTHQLTYHSLSIECVCKGTYESRGKGIRRAKKSLKCDCPFIIQIKNQGGLYRVSDVTSHFNHNEACSKINPGYDENICANKKNDEKKKESMEKLLVPLYGEEITAKFLESVNVTGKKKDQTDTDCEEEMDLLDTDINVSAKNIIGKGDNDDKKYEAENVQTKFLKPDNVIGKKEDETDTDCEKEMDLLNTNIQVLATNIIGDDKQYEAKDVQEEISTQLEYADIAIDDSLGEIVFDKCLGKQKGRPPGSKKLKAIGCAINSEPLGFNDKDERSKVKLLLSFIIEWNAISNVIEGSYRIKTSDLQPDLKQNLSDTFKDENVSIAILEEFFDTQKDFDYLREIVNRKAATETYTCFCGVEADTDTINCDSCKRWLHFDCEGLTLDDSVVNLTTKPYNCTYCQKFFTYW